MYNRYTGTLNGLIVKLYLNKDPKKWLGIFYSLLTFPCAYYCLFLFHNIWQQVPPVSQFISQRLFHFYADKNILTYFVWKPIFYDNTAAIKMHSGPCSNIEMISACISIYYNTCYSVAHLNSSIMAKKQIVHDMFSASVLKYSSQTESDQ